MATPTMTTKPRATAPAARMDPHTARRGMFVLEDGRNVVFTFFLLVFLFALPVFTLVALSAEVAAAVAGLASPGALRMVAISLIGGFMATVIAVYAALCKEMGLPFRFPGSPAAYRGVMEMTDAELLAKAMVSGILKSPHAVVSSRPIRSHETDSYEGRVAWSRDGDGCITHRESRT